MRYLFFDIECANCYDSEAKICEFGYVLTGSIKIHIGTKSYTAKQGEAFYYTPNSNHYIEAVGKNKAIFIWVSTPPSF